MAGHRCRNIKTGRSPMPADLHQQLPEIKMLLDLGIKAGIREAMKRMM